MAPRADAAGCAAGDTFLKDLVTPVDPTSRHSFLNYLRAQRRFYEFLNADQPAILRAEFADYLAWVAGRLGSLRFSWPVEEVGLSGDRLRLAGRSGVVSTGTVVVGTGKRPYLPGSAAEAPPTQCLRSSAALRAMPGLRGKRVALVGGGQSGAELFLAIAQGHFGPAAEVTWISRRATFAALDGTHFVNEWFTPGFVEHFHGLPYRRRLALRPVQKLAGDGISSATVGEIYSHLYGGDISSAMATACVCCPHARSLTCTVTGRKCLDTGEPARRQHRTSSPMSSCWPPGFHLAIAGLPRGSRPSLRPRSRRPPGARRHYRLGFDAPAGCGSMCRMVVSTATGSPTRS